MMSSAADRWEMPYLGSSTIVCSQHRAAATRVRLRRGSSDWQRRGSCSQAVGTMSKRELQSASQGGVAALCTAAGMTSWDGLEVTPAGAHRTCGGGRGRSEALLCAGGAGVCAVAAPLGNGGVGVAGATGR
eukprot:4686848-Amphidinium_carterae.1